ncbi:hypothetical protein SAMN05443429_10235 [Cruoricaptor ignavus]|uniref:Beta/Gamma crystallin n=1 Tax=Cruoricaptor ignavus TaxID=1118202 RepID=A0A1M6BJY2_9FLAO|nr:hypothetical protein [Cruoricaptor ignavus]SHI49090.1 hypothetical protein SAMN05443429_10235 [Cruoricaptor ignavus]
MKKVFILSAILIGSMTFASSSTKEINIVGNKKLEITSEQKSLLLTTFKGSIKALNEDGFTWYDSCGGSHYFSFFKYFSIFEIIEEIWSMDAEYCP